MQETKRVSAQIAGYVDLVRQRIAEGSSMYFVTATFHHIPGKRDAVLAMMFDEIDRFYRRLLTRLVRRPCAAGAIDKLPVLIAAPDMPVGKADKPLRDVVVNGGLHLHGLLLAPPRSRLRMPVDEHVRRDQSAYLEAADGRRTRLAAIDIRPVETGVDLVVAYALKGMTRGRFSSDDMLILPRSSSEMRFCAEGD